MLNKNDIAQLKKHRHLAAAMIDVSIGYFTPLAALNAIRAYKENRPFFCEWYMDTVLRQNRGTPAFDIPETEYLSVNRSVIKEAATRFLRLKSHARCLAIVDRNINGAQSIGASWF